MRGLILIALIIALSVQKSSGQSYTGYEYVYRDDHNYPFKYTRTYSGSGDVFITKYTIYHPTEGYAYLIITATHYKGDKMVAVSIDRAGGGAFAHEKDDTVTYDIPSLKPFGIRGGWGEIGGSRIPDELRVMFVSAKYENVKLGSVDATMGGSTDLIFFTLDQK